MPPLLSQFPPRISNSHQTQRRFRVFSRIWKSGEVLEKIANMEEYLQNMKTLRTQMNDVEDQAAKISVDEQTQITSIHTMETDLESAQSEVKRLKEEIEQMVKVKGQICSQILEKQKKIASLEPESSTLSQTLELIQQERMSLSAKLEEKRSYYTKVMEDMGTKLQEQQDWIHSQKLNPEVRELQSVLSDGTLDKQTCTVGGKCANEIHPMTDYLGNDTNEKYQELMTELDSEKAKLVEVIENKVKIVQECSKIEECIKELNCRIENFPPDLRAMNMKALEEEHKALLSDKAGEMEYLQSLHCQIEKLKGISRVIKCACGEEYKVEMVSCG